MSFNKYCSGHDMKMDARKRHCPCQVLHGNNWRRTGGSGGLASRLHWQVSSQTLHLTAVPLQVHQFLKPLTQTVVQSQAHPGLKPPPAFTDIPVADATFCMFMLEIYCINALQWIYTLLLITYFLPVVFKKLFCCYFSEHSNICIYVFLNFIFRTRPSKCIIKTNCGAWMPSLHFPQVSSFSKTLKGLMKHSKEI